MNIKPYTPLIVIILVFQGVSAAMGMLTSANIETWYVDLAKSPLTPPNYTFGIVWPILYVMLAVSFWMVWKSPQSDQRRNILMLFCAHMVLNWAWTPVFFAMHETFAGLIILIVIALTAVLLCAMIWRINRTAALLFLPYIAWTMFATHLNYYIWQYN